MINTTSRRILSRLPWLVVPLLPGLLSAQNAQPPTEPLEEIVVRATRLIKPLGEVPAAISVVDQADIQIARQQLGLDEALTRVPGLFMQNRYNFAQDLRISIRGFGARSNFGIRGIKILVDGIPETLPDGQGQVDSIDLGAVRRVEILRGPSAALYGNASGGVLSVTSEGGPEIPFIGGRASFGAYDFQKIQMKGGGQTDRVNYFMSLSDTEIDGYRAHSEAENTQLSGRFEFDLGNESTFLTLINFTDQPISNDPGGINAAQVELDRRSARLQNVQYDAGEALEQSRIGFVYRLPLGEQGELRVRNYYVSRDFSNKLPFTFGGAVDLERFFAGGGVSYTHNGTWAGKSNRIIVGFDYDDQDDDRRRFDNDFGDRGQLRLDQNENVTSRGIFLQDEISLSENIEFSFGLRFDEIEFDVQDRFTDDGDDSGSRTMENTSPMLGILANLTPTLNVYGTYSTAFETPTTTEFADPSGGGGFNLTLAPQEATNLEFGLRGTVGERSQYEAAIFHIEVEDELIPFEIPGSSGRDFYENAGKSRRTGLETSFSTQPTERIGVNLTYTYSDFEFTEFVDDNGNDFSGNTIPGTVEHLFFGEITYNHPAGWFGAFDTLYVSEQFANNANTVADDAYALANLRFGYDADLGSVIVSPFLGVNNLFDELYNSNIRINAFGGRYYEPGPERNAYVGVAVSFNFR